MENFLCVIWRDLSILSGEKTRGTGGHWIPVIKFCMFIGYYFLRTNVHSMETILFFLIVLFLINCESFGFYSLDLKVFSCAYSSWCSYLKVLFSFYPFNGLNSHTFLGTWGLQYYPLIYSSPLEQLVPGHGPQLVVELAAAAGPQLRPAAARLRSSPPGACKQRGWGKL